MEDKLLVRRCLRNDPVAWQELVALHGPAVYDTARYTLRRVLGNARREDTENVYQQVFLALCEKSFRRLRSFKGKSALRTWIISVTTRFALNYIRTEKRKGALRNLPIGESHDLVEDPSAPAFPLQGRKEAVDLYINRLSTQKRLLIRLFFFEGLSYRQIAETLKMPFNSISPLLYRARQELREMMEIPGESVEFF